MATTTNFGWETPDDSDLVKDGAAAMRTLGNSIDASMADLRGGTSGQILSKNSNTDMDFTWIANDQGDITAVTAGTGISGGGSSGAVTITNSMATEITAKGDLIVGTGNATFDNLPVGTNGHTLVADSSTATGLKWAAASGGGKVLQVVQGTYSTSTGTTSGTYVDSGLSATITPAAASSKILILVMNNFLYDLASSPAEDLRAAFRLTRAGTSIQDDMLGSWFQNNLISQHNLNFSYLDSPSTTSSTEYKLQFKRVSTPGTAYLQYGDSTASMILMEIGA